jgi:hypothetical protein
MSEVLGVPTGGVHCAYLWALNECDNSQCLHPPLIASACPFRHLPWRCSSRTRRTAQSTSHQPFTQGALINMWIRSVVTFVLFLSLATWVCADSITYEVIVNTASIAGTGGSVDLNFNAGPLMTQNANVQILDFASNGTLAGSPSLILHCILAVAGTVCVSRACRH